MILGKSAGGRECRRTDGHGSIKVPVASGQDGGMLKMGIRSADAA